MLTRTLPWRAVLGVCFVGFFGITALATLVGKPVLSVVGVQSPLGTALWVPIKEELLKTLRVLLILLLARRSRASRPSAGDAVLIGTAVSAGFALYENALFGRGSALFGTPQFSLLFPSGARQIGPHAGMR